MYDLNKRLQYYNKERIECKNQQRKDDEIMKQNQT
jgi:hypothetical protein